MHSITFGNTSFHTAILIKETYLDINTLTKYYLEPLSALGVDTTGFLAVSLNYDKAKPTSTCIKSYLTELLPSLKDLGITTLLCADAEYYKKLAKVTKTEARLGYVDPVLFSDCGLECSYLLSYGSYFHNPANVEKNAIALKGIASHLTGTKQLLGADVLKSVTYIHDIDEMRIALNSLVNEPALAMDIEAFSLKHVNAGIGTISFSTDKHSAVVMSIDAVACEPQNISVWDREKKKYQDVIQVTDCVPNAAKRALLREFFEAYQGKAIWHNASYDVYVLTYVLFMDYLTDHVGLLNGLEVLLRNVEDTQLMVYLCTNSCAGNHLSLKDNAYAFVGAYAIDVTNIRTQPLDELMEYNAIDTCATFYVYEKFKDMLVVEEQLDFYEEYFKPFLHDIIEMQLNGMCIDLEKVEEASQQLKVIADNSLEIIKNSTVVKEYTYKRRLEEVEKRNAAYKTKVIGIDETKFVFNPRSGDQIRDLLYVELGLPVLDVTKSKQPATGRGALKSLLAFTDNEAEKELIRAIGDYGEAQKILNDFINVFKYEHVLCADGSRRIFGSFKLGGTVSARLSSSSPNIQNIPSGSKFGKLVKGCFIAPPYSMFLMSDFNALEDVVNTLLTRDPEKEKVLLDGFDGHMYRACHFWPDKFSHVDLSDPASVNGEMETTEGDKLRSKGKPVHFSQQYQGTAHTLVKNGGFPLEEAKAIEARYKNLYKASFDWVTKRTAQAAIDGYATGAFGLRIRAPLLKSTVANTKNTPYAAAAEARTLGNAISGQSYGLLNGRASLEFMRRVRASPYRHDIKLCAHIHDAIYMYATDSVEVIKWVNDNLIECMAWQELPELQHEHIKLSSKLDIAYPTWKDAFSIENHLSVDEIKEAIIENFSNR